jgi:hypothetical protein
MIRLETVYNTRNGSPVRLSHITTGVYPVIGMYWDSDYREWKEGQWTLSGEFDAEVLSNEDLLEAE